MAKFDDDRLCGDEIPLMLELEAGANPALISPILVGFGYAQKIDERKTREQGYPAYGTPIVFFSAKVPGDTKQHSVHPATEKEFRRFPKAYAAFQNRAATPVTGMPVEQWAAITRAQALVLKRFGINTVEELAAVHDGHLGNFGQQARELRAKARAHLEHAADSAVAERLAAEAEAKDLQLAEMQRQIQEMNRMIVHLQANEEPKRGPGRPRKEEAAA